MHERHIENGFEPVSSRVTISDGVYQQLRDALTVGRFDPGQVLTIRSLADTFGTSQMPVREALRRLGAENALEMASNGSACVPSISVERLDDIRNARVALEGLATEQAAERIRPSELPELERLMLAHESIRAAGDVYEMLMKNRDFHFAIYRASRSEVLVQLIDTLWLRYGPYMRALSSYIAPRLETGLHEPFSEHHHAILDALKAGDAAAARRHTVADIDGTHALLRQLCVNEAVA
ncbi:GntR family transcriptional regulator [Nitratireductor pacificus]|uniref:GntR family transcriptional regulator n=1 Tax=Nitratireductor pacificus pht-3B TaxID=391937 RepID=K2N314_9HYPH|nr:GntR family transcriptional regulator [Nitratireductor pacificus]EKF18593.1 GntR family transcriptional regulator [Nitratireductor pacificus pht-3B]